MEKYFDDVVDNIIAIVKFDSSLSPAKTGKPFGEGAYEALNYFLDLAKALGFTTKNYDNYAGEVIFEGESPESVGILAHLDVVPAGNNWKHNPFNATIENDKIYGRGTVDDKGPAIICLYCLKRLKDEGFLPKKTIKLIVGCGEETSCDCMKHYAKQVEMPTVGFSPDAEFPVIYAEKGILHIRFDFNLPNAPFTILNGGQSPNMVCDYCTAKGKINYPLLSKHGLKFEDDTIISKGKSAHGSTPEKGKNAILPMLEYFSVFDSRITPIIQALFDDIYSLTQIKDETGYLSLSPNIINYANNVLSIACDIRYPATYSYEQIERLLLSTKLDFAVIMKKEPLFVNQDNPVVLKLMSVYNSHVGKNEKPIAIGGGTYARFIKDCVAFGPMFETDEPVIHQADEYISFEKIDFLLKVYYDAIKSLAQ